ncbi:MAG: DEAD/DEAH box helicase, partial [Phycisphaerales bacterium]
TELRAHQATGYRWLRMLHEHALGGLLADDMGLGKTVQVLALLSALDEEDQLAPTLLVLPLTLIGNWVSEMRRFSPTLRHVYVHSGPERLRDPQRIAQAQVVLTTYQTLRRDQLVLGQIDWCVVVCDEAQNAKNPTAQQTSAVKALKARVRLAVTGTPVENGLSELWCIVDFAQPGKLGSQKEFRDEFERPIRDAEDDISASEELATRLHTRLTPHYLRRTKDEVLELPPKTEVTTASSLGDEQKTLYAQAVGDVRAGRSNALEALNRLIALCSHPDIILKQRPSPGDLLAQCPKLRDTIDILEAIRESQERAVVFTRLREMQLILQRCIADRFGLHATIINGTTAGPERLQIVDRFNRREGFNLLILSPEAAGVGLNITGANHVIHYTRLWNPAKENQATDRVHRMGQERRVHVHYPIVRGEDFRTVEERLADVLEEKRALATNVLWARDGLDVQRDLTSLFDDDMAEA